MLSTIRKFFDQNIAPGTGQDLEQSLRLATAALMVEMMKQDDRVRPEEEASVKRSLKKKFGLDDDETEQLLALGRDEARHATDYYQFTSLIKDHFDPEQKIRVIEQLWEVAFADGELDTYEEHMVRRIAELLYVSHGDFIRAKHRAMKALGH